MASNYFSVSVYQAKTSSGSGAFNPYQTWAFPAAGGGLVFQPAPSGTVINSVNIYGIINVLPTGLVVPPGQYYVAQTVAQLVTLANT